MRNAVRSSLFNMATLVSVLALSLLLNIFVFPPCSSTSLTFQSALNQGSSLCIDQVLTSPATTFTAGFHPVGDNAYSFSIWFTDPVSCPDDCTIVWTANRDTPVNGRYSKLSLLRTGNLVLTDAGSSITWETSTNSSVSPLSLKLLETGNLVLVAEEGGDFVWQSFDSPTDTLLPWQLLSRHTVLVSSRSRSDLSSGYYKVSFDEHNILFLVYDGPETSSSFWPVGQSVLSRAVGRTWYNNTKVAVLNDIGGFTSSDNFSFVSTDYGMKIWRRLTVDYDGNLRLYSRRRDVKGSINWVVSWQAVSDTCKIHGICGANSLCSYLPTLGKRTCSCLPGFVRKDPLDWSLGCEPEFILPCLNQSEHTTYLRLDHVESDGYDFGFFVNTTLEECKRICSQRCDCKGFIFKFFFNGNPDNQPYCFPKTLLRNGYRSPSYRGALYLKVPNARNFTGSLIVKDAGLNCPAQAKMELLDRVYDDNQGNWSLKFLIWFVGGVGTTEILGIFLVWLCLFRSRQSEVTNGQVFLLADTGFQRFTYAELKKATRNFREEIGRGASGIVYKGVLSNDRVAAIKKLNESEHGEAEFLAEANTIGRLNHMHLIEMWGYCAEGKHRLLVYEYMEHGSLAENLASKALNWKMRFDIAIGTAKGLAYLHEECLEWVLHCDLKPQNILLDSHYLPKVSDFGLSKLLNRGALDNSIFSTIRGTRGYMAPEWVYRLAITSKVDVYSYGVVLLEMVTGKSPSGIPTSEREGAAGEDGRLVKWVREKMKTRGIEGILDPILIATNSDVHKMDLLVKVALQCVEEDMNVRPSMSKVVEMLLSQ